MREWRPATDACRRLGLAMAATLFACGEAPTGGSRPTLGRLADAAHAAHVPAASAVHAASPLRARLRRRDPHSAGLAHLTTGDLDTAMKAVELGALRYLLKPVDPSVLSESAMEEGEDKRARDSGLGKRSLHTNQHGGPLLFVAAEFRPLNPQSLLNRQSLPAEDRTGGRCASAAAWGCAKERAAATEPLASTQRSADVHRFARHST